MRPPPPAALITAKAIEHELRRRETMHQPIKETGKSSKQRHKALKNSENERIARRLSAARSKISDGRGRSGTRRVRVVPAPGGFAYVED
jgi:hypothetical protein